MGEVPQTLALVESFLNAVDVESAADDFDSLAKYSRWLERHGQPSAGLDEADRRDAVALRDALRAVTRAHHDQSEADPDELTALTDRIRLRARFGPDGVGLESAEEGARTVLGAVLAGVVLAARDGSWTRMKICREDTCQWVFYDQSTNSSKQWCSMRVCGNRNKTRAYRSRQRTEA
jgi:predicted RNA-binding Zn ribbon-like protein